MWTIKHDKKRISKDQKKNIKLNPEKTYKMVGYGGMLKSN